MNFFAAAGSNHGPAVDDEGAVIRWRGVAGQLEEAISTHGHGDAGIIVDGVAADQRVPAGGKNLAAAGSGFLAGLAQREGMASWKNAGFLDLDINIINREEGNLQLGVGGVQLVHARALGGKRIDSLRQ